MIALGILDTFHFTDTMHVLRSRVLQCPLPTNL